MAEILIPGSTGANTGAASGGTAGASSEKNTYMWLVSWVVFFLLLILAAKTRAGYTLIYYALVLLIVFLFLSEYRFFVAALTNIQPISTVEPKNFNPGT